MLCISLQKYLSLFIVFFCKLNSTKKLLTDASFQPDYQFVFLFNFVLKWKRICFCTESSCISPQLLTSHSGWGRSRPSHPRAQIDADRTACSLVSWGDTGRLFLMLDLSAVVSAVSSARLQFQSAHLVSSHLSGAVRHTFYFTVSTGLCSKAVFSEEQVRKSFVVQK